mmetsp:Transcript_5236/g.8975  ORF Transcript_5236/g.8975 Transcript_5236/m.8975 type:complete len:257 (-) Transcript_5236:674-1444(-)
MLSARPRNPISIPPYLPRYYARGRGGIRLSDSEAPVAGLRCCAAPLHPSLGTARPPGRHSAARPDARRVPRLRRCETREAYLVPRGPPPSDLGLFDPSPLSRRGSVEKSTARSTAPRDTYPRCRGPLRTFQGRPWLSHPSAGHCPHLCTCWLLGIARWVSIPVCTSPTSSPGTRAPSRPWTWRIASGTVGSGAGTPPRTVLMAAPCAASVDRRATPSEPGIGSCNVSSFGRNCRPWGRTTPARSVLPTAAPAWCRS